MLAERIDALSESITQWSQARRKLQAGVVKLEQWRENELYRNGLLDQKRTLVEQLSVAQEQLEQKRAVLLEHELELKQVERLIEHTESALDADRLAAEQASLDEWSGVQASISRTTRP
jgi:flagellar export protein FliJ